MYRAGGALLATSYVINCDPMRNSSPVIAAAPIAGRTSWLRRVRLENPLGHGNFLSGHKLSGERDGGLGLARFSAVCPLGGHMYANGL
jgi:hypothetical protein